MSRHTVQLDGPTDLAGFRREARRLLGAAVPPEEVSWSAGGAAQDLFAAPADLAETVASSSGSDAGAKVPAAFLALCERVILHDDAARFGLLYRLLWRLVHEPALRDDPLDADRLRAQAMAKAVGRDVHKMRAFVRFRTVDDGQAEPVHVAWFEPEHHIVEANAPFFMRRFRNMRWAILTPRRCVRWDGEALDFSPGAQRTDAPPADAGEALWLTYYQHIFNPARLKLAMMQKEMPRKYWHNLPEAELIAPLAAQSALRTGRMVEAPASAPRRRIVTLQPEAHGELKGLDALRSATDRCRECPIGAHATQSVFGEGPLQARLMVVGEQPGDQEDLKGRPFVGPSGQLFDKAMADLGWSRERLYITNAVKHFKYELRGQRRIHKTPAQREAEACLHWLDSEIAQVAPQALVALGATAARSLMGRAVAVMSERGQWLTGTHGLPVLVTLHPSALLRGDPAERHETYQRWLADLAGAARYMGAPRPAITSGS